MESANKNIFKTDLDKKHIRLIKSYGCKNDIFNIISEYYDKQDVEILISNKKIVIKYKGSIHHREINKYKILRAIKKINKKGVEPNIENVSKYLDITINQLRYLVKKNKIKHLIHRKKNTSEKIKKRNTYKAHPLYKKMYTVWRGMVQRCHNPNHQAYHRYGLRNIFVCDEWRDFHEFFDDMNSSYRNGLTLDRIDNTKGYYKENCKWSNQSEQTRNTEFAKKLLYNGEMKHFLEIIEILGLEKYASNIRYSISLLNISEWKELIDLKGIKYEGMEFCCIQHFYDYYNIDKIKVCNLMRRYYCKSNKTIKYPSIENLQWYIDTYNSFCINLSKVIKKSKPKLREIILNKEINN